MAKALITKEQVKHVALLARLSLTDGEIVMYTKQLSDVLTYIEQLNEVETKGVEPTYQMLDGTTNVFREDEQQKSLSQTLALSQANETHEGYFLTHNVFGEKKPTQKKRIKRKKIDKHNAILTVVDLPAQVGKKGTVGHKDLYMTEGVETTAGSNVLDGYVAQYSSTVVERFEKKGYKTKYKLNQDAWGHGASGENSDFGATSNPWDMKKVAGGSSSGTGVVVATGEVDFATGTDTCGSIRLPASFNGVSSIKPTYGALSRYGVIAFASSLDCPSIMARSVLDVQKHFNEVTGSDIYDATTQSARREQFLPAQAGKSKFKIKKVGIPKEFFRGGLDSVVKTSVLTAIDNLKAYGIKAVEVSLPYSRYGIATYYIIAPTETSSNLARYDGVRCGNDRSNFGPEAKRRIMLGTFASSKGYSEKYYEKAAKLRTKIIEDFDKVFKSVDAIVGPVSPIPPFDLGEKADDPLSMYLMDIYAAPASLAGIPSLALPCGFTDDGLPIGFQIMGPRWSEQSLFGIGINYQKSTDWHKSRPPGY